MDAQDYKSYLAMTHSDAYTELHRYYTQDTYLDVLGVARQENPHSSFIRWLLNPQSNHGLGDMPFRRFIETICITKYTWYEGNNQLLCDENECGQGGTALQTNRNVFHSANEKYLEELQCGRYEIRSFSALTEKLLNSKRRADIFLDLTISFSESDEKRIIFVIENKVHSQEHKRQTENYADFLLSEKTDEYNDALVMMVYLNAYTEKAILAAIRLKKGGKELPVSHQFVTINYQALLDGVLEPCLPYCDDDRSRMRLSEYIRCLGQARYNENTDDSDYLVMAVSHREAESALRLYEQSQDAVGNVMRSLWEYGSREFQPNETERSFWLSLANVYEYLFDKNNEILQNNDAFKEAVTGVKRQSRKRKYSYNNKIYESFSPDGNNVGKMCRDIICDLINQLPKPFDIDRFREIFGSSSWLRQVIITQDEVVALPQELKYWDKNYKYNAPGRSGKKKDYSCHCIQDFVCSFFSEKSNEYLSFSRKDKLVFQNKSIDYDPNKSDSFACTYTAKDNTVKKLYVAKFWTDSDLKSLTAKIKDEYDIPIQWQYI